MNGMIKVLVIAAWWGTAVFIGRYLLTRWFAREMGWHAMVWMITTLIMLTLAASVELFGVDWWGRPVVRLLAYLIINGVVWWRVELLFTGQWRARRATARRGETIGATEGGERP